jgi:hypothetical protein
MSCMFEQGCGTISSKSHLYLYLLKNDTEYDRISNSTDPFSVFGNSVMSRTWFFPIPVDSIAVVFVLLAQYRQYGATIIDPNKPSYHDCVVIVVMQPEKKVRLGTHLFASTVSTCIVRTVVYRRGMHGFRGVFS